VSRRGGTVKHALIPNVTTAVIMLVQGCQQLRMRSQASSLAAVALQGEQSVQGYLYLTVSTTKWLSMHVCQRT
jgi:hypothetical protein